MSVEVVNLCGTNGNYKNEVDLLPKGDFQCGIYIGLLSSSKYVEEFTHIAYIWHVRGKPVAGTYSNNMFKSACFCFFLVYVCTNVGSICTL